MYSHCTHLTHVGSAVQSIGWVTNYDSGAIIWVWLYMQDSLSSCTSSTPCSSFCPVSAVWWTLSCSILCFLFSSVVCGVLRRSLQEHNGPISAGELPLRFTLRTCETSKKCIFKFSERDSTNSTKIQSTYSTTYEYIHTYIHTYIQTLLVFNMLMWGSLRLASTRAATWLTRSYEINCWSH